MIFIHTPMLTLEDIGQRFKEFETLNDKGIPNIIQNWGNQLIAQMRNNLTKNKSNATSQLLQSMIGKVTTTATGYNVSIIMNDYYVNVENGQPPGTFVKTKHLYDWIENKKDLQVRIISKSPNRIAATKSLAYVIQQKIKENGTEARPFIEPALSKVTTQVLTDRITTYIKDSIEK